MTAGNWESRTVPELRPMPAAMRNPVAGQAVYGDDVRRYRTEEAGSLNGLEFWSTEVSFSVGRRCTGVEYLYTSGQTVHDGGRRPRKGAVSTEWFGSGWENRARDFLSEVESGTSTDLVLPAPWGAITARVFGAEVQHTPGLTWCSLSFQWEEHGHADLLLAEEIPTAAAVLSPIPDDADDMREAALTYTEAIYTPTVTLDDLALLLLELRTKATLYQGAIDSTSLAGVLAEEAVALALGSAVRLFPDRSMIAAVWL